VFATIVVVSQGFTVTLLTSLLTASQLPGAVRQIVLGTTLLVLLSVHGRERGLRQ
jgi:hypothetical protein